jgi:hypothetical protein
LSKAVTILITYDQRWEFSGQSFVNDLIIYIIQQPSEDKKVSFDDKIPAKTVKIVFTPTTDGTVTVDSVDVEYCSEEGMTLICKSGDKCNNKGGKH